MFDPFFFFTLLLRGLGLTEMSFFLSVYESYITVIINQAGSHYRVPQQTSKGA